MTDNISAVADVARRLLPEAAVITDRARLRTYECDGLAHYRVTPALVVVPEDAGQLAAIVRACAEHDVPYVARGSGTGLSGGALPHAEGVLVVTSRMRAITAVRREDQRAVVEPGVINLDVTRAATPHGYYYAPDPSSQQICSIGGNVAENSGGAHCLKYGFTTNHVLGADFVTAEGDVVRARRQRRPTAPATTCSARSSAPRAPSASSPRPPSGWSGCPRRSARILVGFESTDQAGAATSAIISAGIVPAAIEMMDALAIEAAEAAVHCNYPDGAGAVLVIELDGASIEVEQEYAEVERLCSENGAFEQRLATDPVDRALIWKGRKSAFAAVGRISPDYIVQDGVIPRTALPEVLSAIAALSGVVGRPRRQRLPRRRRQPAPAGALRRLRRGRGRRRREGQRRDPRPVHRARRLDHRRARRRHGQGEVHAADVHRRRPRHHAAGPLRVRPGQHLQPRQGLPDAAAVRGGARTQEGRAPVAGSRSGGGVLMATDTLDRTAREAIGSACADVHDPRDGETVDGVVPGVVARPADVDQVAEVLRAATAHGLTVVPRGRGTKLSWGTPPTSADVLLDVSALDRVLDHAAGDLIVAAQAGARLADVQEAVGSAGQRLALDETVPGTSIGGAARRPTPAARAGSRSAAPATC